MTTYHTVSEETIIYALRYGLGRHTYAENDVLSLLRATYRQLSPQMRQVAMEDLGRHIQDMADPDYPRGLHGSCGSHDLLVEIERYENTHKRTEDEPRTRS